MEALQLTATHKVATVSIFTALAVSTDYAMLPFTNVKVMDTVVFVAALVFGLAVGASVGALTWLVYGSLNPYGADGGVLLLILVASEMVYAVLGQIARVASGYELTDVPRKSLLWGSLGLIGALLYDLNTIVTPALLAGVPGAAALASLFPALPFMLAHEVSDFAFFATLGPVMVRATVGVLRKTSGVPRGSAPVVEGPAVGDLATGQGHSPARDTAGTFRRT